MSTLHHPERTTEESAILDQFRVRRNLFDNFITESRLSLYTCPGCGYPTLGERGGYEICSVCDWEDDGQDDAEADEVRGGPNHELTLTQNRITIGRILQNLAEQSHGVLNMNPQEVLKILDDHAVALHQIDIPLEATLQHPAWKMRDEERDRLKQCLIKVK